MMPLTPSLNIIVLDDDEVDIMIIEQLILTHLPQSKVFSATTRHELLKLANDIKPDVILADINLDMDTGFQVAAFIKEASPNKKLPFIFMTGMIKDDFKCEAINYPPGVVLEKPMGRRESRLFVTSILSAIGLTQEV